MYRASKGERITSTYSHFCGEKIEHKTADLAGYSYLTYCVAKFEEHNLESITPTLHGKNFVCVKRGLQLGNCNFSS